MTDGTDDRTLCEGCDEPFDPADSDATAFARFCSAECEQDADNPDYGDGHDDEDDRSMFADPGGKSALRAATPDNPRNLPCPTCGEPNRLTPADRAHGYQCDACADRAEGGGY